MRSDCPRTDLALISIFAGREFCPGYQAFFSAITLSFCRPIEMPSPSTGRTSPKLLLHARKSLDVNPVHARTTFAEAAVVPRTFGAGASLAARFTLG